MDGWMDEDGSPSLSFPVPIHSSTHRPGHERADGGLEDERPQTVPGVEEGL